MRDWDGDGDHRDCDRYRSRATVKYEDKKKSNENAEVKEMCTAK